MISANHIFAVSETIDGYIVDFSESFRTEIASKLYHIVECLDKAIVQYSTANGSFYSKQSSKRNESGNLTYIRYICQTKGTCATVDWTLLNYNPYVLWWNVVIVLTALNITSKALMISI